MATGASGSAAARKAAAKPTRAEKSAAKKQARTDKRTQRKQTFSNIKQAFTLTRENDPRFLPLLIGTVVAVLAIVYVVAFLVIGSPYTPIPIALILAAVAGLFVFSRRAQSSMYNQAEGQAGAAGYMLSQQLRGDWRISQAVAGTTQLDVVHRLVGRPGVVLVGEGAPHRVRPLLAQEKKRTARVVGDTPIYDMVVGTEDGEIRLARLNRALLKLPTNLSREQVGSLEKRLSALGGGRAQSLPQGPMPAGAKMRNVQRAARRRG